MPGTDVFREMAAEAEAKIEDIKRHAVAIAENARAESRDLRDEENESLDRLHRELEEMNATLERHTRVWDVEESVKDRLKAVQTSTPSQYRSAGELLWDMLHAGAGDVDAAGRFRRFTRAADATRDQIRFSRAAEHLGLDKANTVAVAGGFNGLVYVPNVGAVLDPSPQGAPLFSSLGPVPATSATFQRPRIVDPNFDTGVGGGKKEKEEGVSKAWDIVAEPLTLDVFRGYINVSELLLEMVAGSLDMVVLHMNARLEWQLEKAAAAELGSTTAVIPLAADGDLFAALGQAMVAVFTATKRWPTWIAFGPVAAGRLVGMTDAAGRPLFPFLGPANAQGTGGFTGPPGSIGGLTPVPSPAITDADLYVGNGASVEAYLRRFPLMQALEPALFGRQVGVAAAAQFYAPITTEAGPGGTPAAKREGVVKIDWA